MKCDDDGGRRARLAAEVMETARQLLEASPEKFMAALALIDAQEAAERDACPVKIDEVYQTR
jgi:hypothetical protein